MKNILTSKKYEEISNLCNRYNIKNWSINEKGEVDINGDVYLRKKNLKNLPLKFGKVTGNFYCDYNQLTSLEGAPQGVGKFFYCDYNKLTSLVGAPQEAGGGFYFGHNRLTSLEGGPQKVGGSFYCDYNQLTSLVGAPQEVDGSFSCDNNQLTSLVGAPQRVGGDFYCDYNPISDYYPFFKNYYQADMDLKKCIEKGIVANYSELIKNDTYRRRF